MNTNVTNYFTETNKIAFNNQLEIIKRIEAAKILGVGLTTINNYVKRGYLKPIKIGTAKQCPVFFRLEEVLNLIGAKPEKNAWQR